MKVKGRKEPFELQRALPKPVPVLCKPRHARFRDGLESESPLPPLQVYWRFLVAGLTRHVQTGAVVPSQRFLVRRMISAVPAEYRGRLVELGAGTGALTLRLAERCRNATILACEINRDLAQLLQERLAFEGLDTRVKVTSEPAEHLLSALAKGRRGSQPDFVFSGIPLGNLARRSAVALIDLIYHALSPGGLYIQFQYSLLDRKKIKARFSRMRTLPALLNFPPAFVYQAWK